MLAIELQAEWTGQQHAQSRALLEELCNQQTAVLKPLKVLEDQQDLLASHPHQQLVEHRRRRFPDAQRFGDRLRDRGSLTDPGQIDQHHARHQIACELRRHALDQTGLAVDRLTREGDQTHVRPPQQRTDLAHLVVVLLDRGVLDRRR